MTTVNIKGDYWSMGTRVTKGAGNIKSKEAGLIDIPLTGWEYYDRDGDGFYDDNTLTVTGNNYSCCGELLFHIL